MNQHLSTVFIGVIGGMISAFIWLVLAKIWSKIIVPWYENIVYQDAKIEGKWNGVVINQNDEKEDNDVILLKRTGHRISGTITCVEGKNKGGTYIVEGSFRNLILTASYEAQIKEKLDRGSIALMLVDNGKRLIGYSSYYQDETNSIQWSKYEWERNHKA